MNAPNSAFIAPALPLSERKASTPLITTRSANLTIPAHTPCTASLRDDFFSGPESPPRPRPLNRVILFSVATGALWYGLYKYNIEEELRASTGEGLGGLGTLLPFVIGVTSPLYLPTGGPAEIGAAFGVLWIVCIQYTLYTRINRLCEAKGMPKPLRPEWLVIPGFNLVVGLRSVHFLSVVHGGDRADPMVERLPFLGVDTLGFFELLTSPKLWLKL